MDIIRGIDESTLRYVQEHFRGDELTAVLIALTRLGDLGLCWIVPGCIMLRDKRTRRRGIELLTCLSVCLIINNFIIKNVVDRTRPFDAMAGLDPIIKPPTDWSFPSGHSAAAFASAYAIAKGFGKKLGVPAYALATAIAASRIGVGVHYPTDVIVGAGVGTAISAATLNVMRRGKFLRERRDARIAALRARREKNVAQQDSQELNESDDSDE